MDIKDYRQPMVTSIGVILGFLVGFLGQWVTESDFALINIGDYIVFIGCFFGVVCLLASLFRMLSPKVPQDVHSSYVLTFRIYIVGIIVAFSSLLLSVFFD